MARFKVFWSIAAVIIFGFIMTTLFTNSNFSLFQNTPIQSEWTENIEAKFMTAYNSTVGEYGGGTTEVLDPCNMRDSLGDIGISKCGNPSPDHECSGNGACFSGVVGRIIDGDTIMVGESTVRFALASAPELSESNGQKAKKFIENTCPVGSNALVDEDDGQTEGSFGRIVA